MHAMKPSDTRLQHAKVWSTAKLLQCGTATQWCGVLRVLEQPLPSGRGSAAATMELPTDYQAVPRISKKKKSDNVNLTLFCELRCP